MTKSTFLSLLYLLGIAPLLFALSVSVDDANPFVVFGLLNIVVLSIYTLLFSKTDTKKKSLWLALISAILFVSVIIFGLSKLGSGATDRLFNKALAPEPMVTSGEVMTGNTSSWEVLTGENEEILSGDILEPETQTGEIEQAAPEVVEETPKVVEEPAPSSEALSDVSESETLSYAQIIPYLVNTYKLSKIGSKTFTFTTIGQENSLYPSFAIAASHSMIWSTINPSTKPSCDTYLVLKGIAQQRKVDYTWAPQAAYRAKANELGQVNNCKAGNFVTKVTL